MMELAEFNQLFTQKIVKTNFFPFSVINETIDLQSIDEADKLVSSEKFNVIDDVRERLECCENLMECWLQCLTQLEKFGKLPASQVQGVVENLVEVIKRSFKHCKARSVIVDLDHKTL